MRSFTTAFLLIGQLMLVAVHAKTVTYNNLLKQARYGTTHLRLCVQLSQYYYDRSHLDGLYPYLKQGMLMLTRVPSPRYGRDLRCFLASYYHSTGLRPLGVELAQRSKTASKVLASLEWVDKALEATGNFERVLTVYEEYQQLEQKFNEYTGKPIAQMQAQFESEPKNQTVNVLQKNAPIDQLEALRQQQVQRGPQQAQLTNAIIICLLLLLLGIIFFFLQKARQSNILLQQTTQKLLEANTIKDKLFSVISHDLRSPLASIKNTLYQSRQSNDPSLTAVTNRLERQVDSVINLLTNLLDWSVLQLKENELIQEPLLLKDIVDETISQTSDLIEQKQLGLISQIGSTHVVVANKHQLRAVLRNLLNNAIKFTPANGYIRLQSSVANDFIELTIRDSGIGMSAEQLAVLLTKPEVRAGTAGEAGSGLGLRICKELVDRSGGTLQVDSWLQKGTLVRLQFKSKPGQAHN